MLFFILFYMLRENDDYLKMFLLTSLTSNNNYSYVTLIIVSIFYIYNIFINTMPREYFDIKLIFLRLKTKHYFNNVYSLKIEGDKTIKTNNWSGFQIDTYSDNFIAFINFIENNNCIKINKLEEDININDNENDKKKKKNIFFIVNQEDYFKIDNDIYCKITKTVTQNEDDNKIKHYSKGFTTIIELISFKYNTYDLNEFINRITRDYKDKIHSERHNKKYIYAINKITSDDEFKTIKWHEHEFNSNKTFDNLFINNKEEIIKKISFFQNNKEWYSNKGNPYTLGIGLYGPPGTGKTSFIKALSKMLNRHLIIIPLSKLNTEEQLYDAFYEKGYNKDNADEIDFHDKIICFEDIDCMSDIVNNRKDKHNNDLQFISNIPEIICDTDSDDNDNKKSNKKMFTIKKEKEISLSYLLNLLDGIVEHPGRIVVLTSNHYDKLDPALVRPGRIDIEIELNKASVEQISDFYYYYYNTNIPKEKLKLLKDNVISPCEIINIYGSSINKKDFLNKIINFKTKTKLLQ